MKKYSVYLKNSPAVIMVIADAFIWNDTEVSFMKDELICAVFRMSEVAGWSEMNNGGGAE